MRSSTGLRGLRTCTAEQARAIRPVAEHDRSVLPRWQRYGEGVHGLASPAAYAGLRPWRSREHWLEVVVPAVIAARPDVMARHPVSEVTLRYYLRVLSLYAAPRDGRRTIVRPDRLAELMEVSERTVQRAQALAVDLGLYVIVVAGRMLTVEETVQARRQGSRQRGLSNEAALVEPVGLPIPAPRAPICGPRQDDVTPTRGVPAVDDNLSATCSFARSPKAEELAAKRPGGVRPPRRYDPAALGLALELREVVPWLREVAPGRLEPGLRRFAAAPRAWLARDLVEAIDATNRRMGWSAPAAGKVRNPHALLAHYLGGFDVEVDHPRLYLDPEAERTPPLSRVQAANVDRLATHRAKAAAVPPPPQFRAALQELRGGRVRAT